MRGLRVAFGALVIAAASACGGNSTGPNNSNNNNSQFFMRATVDGAWQATVPVTVHLVSPGAYSMTGTQVGGANGYVIAINLFNIKGPGTYPLGVGTQVPGGVALLSSTTSGWTTPLSGAAGTINITTLTSSLIAGTFNFTADMMTGGSGSKTVSNGQFNLQVTPLGTVGPVPDNAGSIVSATLNNAAWNAAAVAGNLTGSPTNLTIVAGNLTGSMTISLANITAPGTYPLSAASRSIGYGAAVPGQVWSSSGTGGSGSVTVSSITATRIRGTFTATLAPLPGSSASGTVTIAGGTFDVGRPF